MHRERSLLRSNPYWRFHLAARNNYLVSLAVAWCHRLYITPIPLVVTPFVNTFLQNHNALTSIIFYKEKQPNASRRVHSPIIARLFRYLSCFQWPISPSWIAVFSVSNILTHLKVKVKEGQILFLTFHISRSLCLGIAKIEMCAKIANTAQTPSIGCLPYFPQQIAHRATHGETRLKTLSPRCWRGDVCNQRLKLSVNPANLVVSLFT